MFHPSPVTGVGAWPRSSNLHEVILQCIEAELAGCYISLSSQLTRERDVVTGPETDCGRGHCRAGETNRDRSG